MNGAWSRAKQQEAAMQGNADLSRLHLGQCLSPPEYMYVCMRTQIYIYMCVYLYAAERKHIDKEKKKLQTKSMEKSHKLYLGHIFLEHQSRLYSAWAALKHC